MITSASDALAVVLNERGHVDPDHIAELLHRDVEDVNRRTGGGGLPRSVQWLLADVRCLSVRCGSVEAHSARAAADLDPAFQRNVAALERVSPPISGPSDITARLGAPWIPPMTSSPSSSRPWRRRSPSTICRNWRHGRSMPGNWNGRPLAPRNGARIAAMPDQLLSDALNSSVPQIFDAVPRRRDRARVLNSVETEAAKEKLAKIKSAFHRGSGPIRIVRSVGAGLQRHLQQHRASIFNGDHLQLPGASGAFSFMGIRTRDLAGYFGR